MSDFTPFTRRVKNNTASTKTWMGVVIEPGAYHTLYGISEAMEWARDPEVNTSLTSGEMITNDGTTDITNPVAAKNILRIVRRHNVPLVVTNTLIQLSSYNTIGRYLWVKNRNVTYRAGTALIDINVPNLSAQVRIIDTTNNVVLGSASYSSSGIYQLDFNNPTTDCRIEIQVKLTGLLGILTPPSLNCLSLEWDT